MREDSPAGIEAFADGQDLGTALQARGPPSQGAAPVRSHPVFDGIERVSAVAAVIRTGGGNESPLQSQPIQWPRPTA